MIFTELPRYRDKCYINELLCDKCFRKGLFSEKFYAEGLFHENGIIFVFRGYSVNF